MKITKKLIIVTLIIFIQIIIISLYGILYYKVNAEADLISEGTIEDSLELIKLKQQSSSATTIPAQYDLRDNNPYGFSNHGNLRISSELQIGGTCWDYATMMALQTTLAKKNNSSTYRLLSKTHLDYMASKYSGKNYSTGREIAEGGNFSDALSYFKNNDGPVLATNCYYTFPNEENSNEKVTILGTSYNNNTADKKRTAAALMDNMEPDYYVHEVVNFPGVRIEGPSAQGTLGTKKMYYTSGGQDVSESEMKEIRDAVKRHIMTNGGVYCSIRTHHYFIGANLGAPYNTYDGKYSQYDDGSIKGGVEVDEETTGGHAITIIGWNDNYSRSKFNAKNKDGQIVHPTSNGAWLIVNNGGDGMWENGCQWISYEDYNVQADLHGFVSANSTKKEYTYKFEEETVYTKLKSLCTEEEVEVDCTDNTKTVKGLDLIFNDFSALNFSRRKLADKDLNTLLKYKLPKLKSFIANVNQISNVGVLSNYDTIKELKLSRNNISDVTPLPLSQYDVIDLRYQTINEELSENETEYSYPSIVLEAKKPSSKLYSDEGLTLVGCQEKPNGKGIVLTDNTATITINSGNAAGTKLTIERNYTIKIGDVDGNGTINLADVLKLRRYLANSSKWNLSDIEKTRADVNQDGQWNVTDVLKLRRYIAASSNSSIANKHQDWLW